MNKSSVINLIKEYSKKIPDPYQHPFRFYHNATHIIDMLSNFIDLKIELDENDVRILFDAILYHDVVYKTTSEFNEERSADVYANSCCRLIPDRCNEVMALIKSTKMDAEINSPLKALINLLDLFIFTKSIEDVKKYDYAIFKEFQSVPFKHYRVARMNTLKQSITEKLGRLKKAIHGFYPELLWFIDRMETGIGECIKLNEIFRPKIGIYVGSFSPFHIGHMHIVKKAEKIFDKVIIIKGVNHNKINLNIQHFPVIIDTFYESKYHEGSILDIINDTTCSYADYTMIRGLRSAYDLNDEQNYMATLRDIGVDIGMVHILSDAKYQHISSSMVRSLKAIEDSELYHMYDVNMATLKGD